MKHYHKNPRKITDEQLADLKRWMQEFGDLGCIVHNERTDEIISANQRMKVIGLESGNFVIEETFEPPTPQGTVARGHVVFEGEKFTYRRVSWSEDTARRALLVANQAGGDWDNLLLKENFDDILKQTGFEDKEIEAILSTQHIELPNEEAEEEKVVYPITPKFSEQYSCLTIVVKNEIDWNWLKENLGLEKMQSYKSQEVGLSHIIDFEKFTEAWKLKS